MFPHQIVFWCGNVPPRIVLSPFVAGQGADDSPTEIAPRRVSARGNSSTRCQFPDFSARVCQHNADQAVVAKPISQGHRARDPCTVRNQG